MPPFRRRRFRRATAPRRSPYEMQQISICRTGMTNFVEATCTTPAQFLTGLVSPRREFAGPGSPGTEIIPAFSKGVTVGGIKFRYNYGINTLLAIGMDNIVDLIEIRSALVVLPLADNSTENPGVFPTNLLHYSGTIPETQATFGLGYTRPRVLWRGFDTLKFTGADNLTTFDDVDSYVQVSNEQPDLQIVKSKVSLGHNEALYFCTEYVSGVVLSPTVNFLLELDLFGVAAVKPVTATR